jgi:hypothetical protein
MAFEAGLGALAGIPAISQATILSGILAVMVDVDHVELPPHRTPAGHSLPSAAFWVYVSAATAYACFPEWTAVAALASACAFATHLSLDAFTGGGIFLWPRSLSVREWFQPVPDMLLMSCGGRCFLASDELDHQALADGRLAWPGWRMCRAALPAILLRLKLPCDAMISSLGLLCLVAAVAWG